MYLLDTDTCSFLMRRYSSRLTQKFLDTALDDLAMSAISQAEIYYGFAKNEVGLERRLAAETFFESIRVLDWPQAAAQEYGRVRAFLRRVGTPVGDHDLMIAAHAIALDAVLVTNNIRHFAMVGAPLRLENWVG